MRVEKLQHGVGTVEIGGVTRELGELGAGEQDERVGVEIAARIDDHVPRIEREDESRRAVGRLEARQQRVARRQGELARRRAPIVAGGDAHDEDLAALHHNAARHVEERCAVEVEALDEHARARIPAGRGPQRQCSLAQPAACRGGHDGRSATMRATRSSSKPPS